MTSSALILTSRTCRSQRWINSVASLQRSGRKTCACRAFFPDKNFDLNAAFAEIERELRTQYLIAYSSTNKKRDGSYRKITIEITNPDLRKEKLEIRHRPGYYANKR